MKIRSYCIPCSRVVSTFAKKYNLNSNYIWEEIECFFNMEKGWGNVMTQEEIDELEQIITEE